jgi:hypothetical protein
LHRRSVYHTSDDLNFKFRALKHETWFVLMKQSYSEYKTKNISLFHIWVIKLKHLTKSWRETVQMSMKFDKKRKLTNIVRLFRIVY